MNAITPSKPLEVRRRKAILETKKMKDEPAQI